ncbi:ThiF family adenylyltransferase [Methylobacterium sp. J-078]|uniref:ThiF family adenylyltransferase n=1 Tax=Methylobacterium sp. J-078 TaxID=2836657 RepID=UPI001FBBEA17|nr:ThiF family adenylyltransferase [Methylobacterium sp. J-078]MCJ2046809.1 ThiF family adenylyltransferase [Methylobacterium sp. J-078]
MAWIDEWAVIPIDDLVTRQARAIDAYMRTAPDIATVVEARRHPAGPEMLLVDIRTGVPQRPVVPIERIERIGIALGADEAMPFVVMLREDFPDTEHQQLVPEGFPSAMCIDDRPWDEARLTWSPAELLQRVHLWFRRAARGELHDPHQPVDPFFGLSPLKIVVPTSVLSGTDDVELVGFRTSDDDPDVLMVLPVDSMPRSADASRIIPVAYTVPPERMTRMRRAPRDLAALAAVLSDRGVAIIPDLQERVRRWAGSEAKDRARLNGALALIVAMPVVAPNGDLPGLIDLRVFITQKTVGEVGVALGVLLPDQDANAASGFVRAIPSRDVDGMQLTGCVVEMAQVHRAFDAGLAATLGGRQTADARKVVMVGAGAIGSHVAESLIREGRYEWCIVDDDRLLPHNLARHTLGAMQVGQVKAAALGHHLNAVFQPTAAGPVTKVIGCNVLRPGPHADDLGDALAQAAVVIDASASVAASRHLSDLDVPGRRASIFFNPSAEAAVVLVEPEDRSTTLRDLEAQYYRSVLLIPALERHLTATGERFAYTGACRAVTNRVPEARVALLSSLAAMGLARALDAPGPSIGIWTLAADGGVSVTAPVVAPIERHSLAGWEITIDAEARSAMVAMREGALPAETGGSVIGVVDGSARKIHIVEPLPPPPDSRGTPAAFERGIEGLSDHVTGKMARVMDMVRYVGEWHSHPSRHPVDPSPTDIVQLCHTAIDTALDSLPGLSLILGDDGLNVVLAEKVG